MRHPRAAIERYFVQGLRPRAERRMRRHVSGCAGCRRHYVRLLVAERALVPGEAFDRTSPRARERAVERLLSAVAPSRRRWRVYMIGGLALAAATTAGLMLWMRPEPPRPLRLSAFGDAFDVRGVPRERPRNGVDLRLICVAPADGLDIDTAERFAATELIDGDDCGPDAALFLAYTALPPEMDHVFVLGVDSQGLPHAYYPRPGEVASRAIEPGTVDGVLGNGVVVGRRHPTSGEVTLVAVFSAAPIAVEAMHARLATVGADRANPARWAADWEGVSVVVRRFRVPPQ